MAKSNSNTKLEFSVVASMMAVTLISGAMLSSMRVNADTDAVDEVNITVPSACTMSGNIATGQEHTASINPNTYQDNIGKTTITAFCNDSGGYAIYAIGFTGDKYDGEDHTKLIGTNTDQKIITGTAKTGTSQWAMRITPVTGTYAPTIENDFDSTDYHVIPNTYEKVATYGSTTDAEGGIGSSIETTYAAYISGTQAADTYTGKVKYTLVHPSTEVPTQPQTTQTGKIRYYANVSDYEGTMAEQDIVKEKDWSSCEYTNHESYCYDSNHNEIDINTLPEFDTYVNTYTLLPSNFSRTGYGFAGWSDKFDYATNPEAKFYGPMETITLNTADYTGTNPGLSLYAVWVKSQGSLQDSAKVATVCNSLAPAPIDGTANLSSVSALTDQRDNNTYAIAKLADGKCWMIENLKLDNTATGNSDGSLAQGYGGQFAGLANPETSWATYSTTANSLYSTDGADNTINIGTSNAGFRFPRYNNQNISDRASTPATDANTYGYGNYYTWAATIADTTEYTSGDHNTTSICPSGWQIPLGDTSTGDIEQGESDTTNKVGGFSYLDRKMGGTGDYQSTAADSLRWRKYPVNFLYSGYVVNDFIVDRGSSGYYWSSTASNSNDAYILHLNSSYVYPGAGNNYRYLGRTIRCLVSF